MTRRLAFAVLALTACADTVHGDAQTAVDARDTGAVDGTPSDSSMDATMLDSAPSDSSTDASTADAITGSIELPPANAAADYQLGGAYAPAASVRVVSRDRNDAPASGLYNICYVNGFQIQDNETSFWTTMHPNLVLRGTNGNPVIDADWNEMLIDVSTPAKRSAVAAIVGEWIRGCAQRGFDAVEIDNLDSYTRSTGLLDANDAVATVRLFADIAHANGLAIAQKNSAELVSRRAEMATDFAVAEECIRYSECDTYTNAYGDHVIVIEYRRADFDAGCAAFPQLSIVLRDRNLVTPGNAAYVFDGC